jgi:3-deoxy-D-manno-octulosonic-acid transferase
LATLAGVAAQGQDDAARLSALGAPAPVVAGNIKFDFLPDASLVARGEAWRRQMGNRPVWVAASTREGEEALLLEALASHRFPENALLVLVPRHPQRFDEVAGLIAARALCSLRRSDWAEASALPADVQVLLGDSMGELPAYYAASDVAVMGGSLLDFGSHSVIEPCAQGLPVLLGPSTFNFADAVKESVALGAAEQFADIDTLLVRLVALLGDAAQRDRMGEAGQAFVRQHRGAVNRVLQLLP